MSAQKSAKQESQSSQQWPSDWLDRVIIRQWQIQPLNGEFVVVPKTESVQTYYPEQYEKMLENRFFEDCSMKHEVLHDPMSK